MQQRQESWSRAARSASSSSTQSDTPARSPVDSPLTAIGAVEGTTRSPGAKRKEGGRKKVAKACLACQRSHLTCDDKRPCTRCVKKGIGHECVEGVRKKAKYLLEGEERAAAGTASSSSAQGASLSPVHGTFLPPPPAPLDVPGPSRASDDVWLNPPMAPVHDTIDPSRFWSDLTAQQPMMNNHSAATNEFEMLDSMFNMDPMFPPIDFNDVSFLDPTPVPPLQPTLISPWPVLSPPNPQLKVESYIDTGWLQNEQQPVKQNVIKPVEDTTPAPRKGMTSHEVYKTITKPYDYTEGYHILMEFMAKNFEQRDVLRVVKALASYRPSLIALQMPMSEDDEIFLEKSFQRTLIELEKLISYSATPTAVWRRTGEVCYANPEFCKLVEKDGELFSGKTYIYQLFARTSVVPYWESFAVHAFENTSQNFFQQASLAVGGRSISCSCCFTIRRDVFDLPSVIIGQFLPMPAESM